MVVTLRSSNTQDIFKGAKEKELAHLSFRIIATHIVISWEAQQTN